MQAYLFPHPCMLQLHIGHCLQPLGPTAAPGIHLPTRREGSPCQGLRKLPGSPRPGLILAWPLASCVALGKTSSPKPQFPPLSSEERGPPPHRLLLSTWPTVGAPAGPCLPAQPSLGT